MRRMACMAAALSLSLSAVAGVSGGFGLDAFNRTISVATRGNAVFSPASFEFDCVVFSEAFGALTRAKFAETMGVLTGLEAMYKPAYEQLSAADGTNTSFVTARAFCLPDERKANVAYRQWLQRTFEAEAFSFDFRQGADCWFRARMDGEMEDFKLPDEALMVGYYSYYDLVFVHPSWMAPFPADNTGEIEFRCDDGSTVKLAAMRDLRLADIWQRERYSAIRLPLADGSWFFAIMPNDGVRLRNIRHELSSATLVDFMAGFKSIIEKGLTHDAAMVAIPKLDITVESDLDRAFAYFRFPVSDMERIAGAIRPALLRQRVRLRLDETGPNSDAKATAVADRLAAATTTRSFVLDRPFLFFIYNERAALIPVVGQFTGR